MALYERLSFKLFKTVGIRCTGSQAAPALQAIENCLETFRTQEADPSKHITEHLGRFYTIERRLVSRLIGKGTSPLTDLKQNISTFAEWSILIRKPALEIIQYLSQTDYSKPVNKYILYGEDGTGKTMSLCHVVSYAYLNNKLIIYEPWVQRWFRYPAESSNSLSKEGLVDLPIDAARFLVSFRYTNQFVLQNSDIRLSKTYNIGVQETFEKGTPLIDLIEFGITRAKYACDVLDIVFDEVKQASIEGKCNTLVAIDGYNAFYTKATQVKNDQKIKVPASKVTLTHSFLKMTKSDWCNGQIVITVDKKAVGQKDGSHLPRYLLDKEGFDHLDPFLPIGVENYTQDEFDTVIDYYLSKKWIREISPDGRKELRILCGSNPYKFMDYCKHL